MIEGAGLKGPEKMLAVQSECVRLTESGVLLRTGVSAFATQANRKVLSDALARYFGRAFRVDIEAGRVDEANTVRSEERLEDEARRRAMLEDFRKEPLVKRAVELFGGTIDENSIEESRKETGAG